MTDDTTIATASTSLFDELKNDVVTDAKAVEAKAVAIWDNNIKPFFVNDIEPFLKSSVLLIERNGGALLLQVGVTVLNDIGEIAEGKWGDAVATVVTEAKAAGVQFAAQEEQLAAGTALQLAQAAQAAPTANVPVATTTAATVVAAAQS